MARQDSENRSRNALDNADDVSFPQTTATSSAINRSFRPELRSGIACRKCRKDKLKCKNDMSGDPCERCQRRSIECLYESVKDCVHDSSKRSSRITKRQKTSDIVETGNGNLLDISGSLWQELFQIYLDHYFYEFPFLHRPSFLQRATQAAKESSVSPSYPPGSELLFAFLAITAPLHHGMTSGRGNGSATPNIFMEAALSHIGMTYREASLEGIQALLMVGYLRWFGRQDPLGIADIKLAIERAKAMGYQQNHDETTNVSNGQDKDQSVTSESRRRTFWSCFVMDSHLRSMAQRPPSIRIRETLLQLPCTEHALLHGQNIMTKQLGEDEVVYKERRADIDEYCFEVKERELRLFIQFLSLWGEIMDVSHSQERRGVDNRSRDHDLDRLEVTLLRQMQAVPEIYTHKPEFTSISIRIQALRQLCVLGLNIASVSLLPWNLTTLQESQSPFRLRLIRTLGVSGFAGLLRPFLETLVGLQQSQLELPQASAAVVGFAAYSTACALLGMNDQCVSTFQRELRIVTTFIALMCDVWKLPAAWRDDLEGRMRRLNLPIIDQRVPKTNNPLNLEDPGSPAEVGDNPSPNLTDEVEHAYWKRDYYDPIRDPRAAVTNLAKVPEIL